MSMRAQSVPAQMGHQREEASRDLPASQVPVGAVEPTAEKEGRMNLTTIEIDAFCSHPGRIQSRLNVALLLLRQGDDVRISYFHERVRMATNG